MQLSVVADLERTPTIGGALETAQSACLRGLDAVRRIRRLLDEDEGTQDPLPVAEELTRLERTARLVEARFVADDDLPDADEVVAGLLHSGLRTVEGLLRFTAHHGAEVHLLCASRCLRITVISAVPRSAWDAEHDDLDRIRERLRWFDGRLAVEDHPRGTRAVVELPV